MKIAVDVLPGRLSLIGITGNDGTVITAKQGRSPVEQLTWLFKDQVQVCATGFHFSYITRKAGDTTEIICIGFSQQVKCSFAVEFQADIELFVFKGEVEPYIQHGHFLWPDRFIGDIDW